MGKCIKCGTNFIGTAANPPGDGLCRYCEMDELRAKLAALELKAADSDAWQEVVMKVGAQRDELQAKLDASERARAEMRDVLEVSKNYVLNLPLEGTIDVAGRIDKALSSDAGRDYVPKAQWLRLGEALNVQNERWGLYTDESQQALEDYLAARDARKADGK